MQKSQRTRKSCIWIILLIETLCFLIALQRYALFSVYARFLAKNLVKYVIKSEMITKSMKNSLKSKISQQRIWINRKIAKNGKLRQRQGTVIIAWHTRTRSRAHTRIYNILSIYIILYIIFYIIIYKIILSEKRVLTTIKRK